MKRSKTALWCLAAVCFAGGAGAARAGDALRVGSIEIKGALADQPSPLAWLVGEESQPTLRATVDALHGAADRSDLDTVVIRLKDATLRAAQAEELGEAIGRIRASGKKVRVFAESYDTTDFLLASYADEAIIQDGGGVSLPGLSMEEMFLADTLAWIGVKPQMVQVGDYKGANEMFMNAAPSKAWDENISQLLDGMYGAMRAPIMAGRKMDGAALDKAMAGAWLADADEAVKLGLLDAAIDWPALSDRLAKDAGKTDATPVWVQIPLGDPAAKVDMSNPFALFQILAKKPSHTPKGPTIAVVHIDGMIVDGKSSSGMFGGETVGSRTIRGVLADIEGEKDIKGVIIRVDSPGGSATASEVMWQGIRRVAEKKPVWVSVGSMAASGGFYVSVAGDRIYVSPSSIVGSIGVVGGKFSMGGLYEKIKLHTVTRSRGPRAAMMDGTRPWTPEEEALVRERMTRTFDLFKSRVAAGRKGIDLSRTAGGWLFTGEKAIQMKMADKIGGLEDALTDMAKELGLRDYDVMDYPGPKGIDEMLEEAFGSAKAPGVGGAGGPLGSGVLSEFAAAVQAAVGQRSWPCVRDTLNAMMLLREEPVVLTVPRALIFK